MQVDRVLGRQGSISIEELPPASPRQADGGGGDAMEE